MPSAFGWTLTNTFVVVNSRNSKVVLGGWDKLLERDRKRRVSKLFMAFYQKTKIMASGPITSWEIDGQTVKQCQTLFFEAPKSLQMVTAATKLKDTYSLEGKL